MSHSLIRESICLSSEDAEPAQPAKQTTNRRFEQRGVLCRCEARFRVYNEHYIEVATRGLLQPGRHYELDCTFLDPDARRSVSIDRWSAGACLLLAGSALLLAWLPGLSGFAQLRPWLPATLLAFAAVPLVLCLQRSRDTLVFHSYHGRVPLLTLLNRKPSPASLAAFVADIGARSAQARAQWPDKAQLLSAELREHRRLKDAGVIDADTYETVKRRILEAHGSRNHAA